MTREEQLDWLYRLKSNIPVYLPAEWGIPMGNALDMAIKALEQTERYKPIFLQEHDAEPRRLIAILDVKKDGIYILETTKGFAESMGMTIEDRNAEE